MEHLFYDCESETFLQMHLLNTLSPRGGIDRFQKAGMFWINKYVYAILLISLGNCSVAVVVFRILYINEGNSDCSWRIF